MRRLWRTASKEGMIIKYSKINCGEGGITLCCAVPRYSVTCNSLEPMDCSPPASTVHGTVQARILEWVAMSSSRGSSRHRNWILVSHITGRFLLSEPPGKPRNTAVGSLSLLQGIFPNQESNWVLRHWRWILYQLSYVDLSQPLWNLTLVLPASTWKH